MNEGIDFRLSLQHRGEKMQIIQINISNTMKRTLYLLALVCAVVLASCTSKNGLITKGDKSQLDTLSYAFGSDIGFGMFHSMGDIPFDMAEVTKGIEEGALGKASMTHEEALKELESFFSSKYQERLSILRKSRAESKQAGLPEPSVDTIMFESVQERQNFSYAFGVDMGNNLLTKQDQPIQIYWFNEGILDNYGEGGNPRMTHDECLNFLRHYFMVVLPERNKKECEEWLAKIEKEPGVQKTDSGLLYKIEEKGDETVMAKDPRDTVMVHYIGINHKGDVFDSSRFENKPEEVKERMLLEDPEIASKEDKPFPTALNRVIKGWTEGLMLVGKGGKITLWIPSELAYGGRGMNRMIPANEALKFEIEVLDVIPYVENSDSTNVEVKAADVTPAVKVVAE